MQLLNRWLTGIALGCLIWVGLITAEPSVGLTTSAQAASLPSSLVAYLPPGNAITDGRALLRYSLPIDNSAIRKIQANLEGLSEWLRSKRWGSVKRDLNKLDRLVGRSRQTILADIPADQQALAATYLDDLRAGIEPMLVGAEDRDRETIWLKRAELLDKVGALETMLNDNVLQAVRAKGALLKARLDDLAGRHPCVGHVGGHGLFYAVDIVNGEGEPVVSEDRWTAFTGDLSQHPNNIIGAECAKRGVFLGGFVPNTIKVGPPFTITEDEIDMAVNVFDEALTVADALYC
ncbi:MAG: aminotransferase class III-fold pyridoxal phosphate-dependent enzyme [Cyanobacteria bacterium P01_E01_bin.43]